MASISQTAITSPKKFWSGAIPALVANPTAAPTLAAATDAGSTLAAGTYYIKYTWVDTAGVETSASPEASQVIAAGQRLTITMPAMPTNCNAIYIYASTTTGTEKFQTSAVVSWTSGTVGYINKAIQTTNAAAPTVNATSGWVCYTSPANTSSVPTPFATAILKEIAVCNTASSTQTFSLIIGSVMLFASVPVAPNDTKIFTGLDTMLNAGDMIAISCSTNSTLTLMLSGVEVQ